MFKIENNSIIVNKVGDINILSVTDLHLRASNFKGRYDYPGEVLQYLKDIDKIVEERQIDILLLYGDIFDNHFTESGALQYYNQITAVFKSIADKCLIVSLMGNHDLHNYKTTPFFSVVELHSNRIALDLKAKYFNPICTTPLIYAPDRLIINDNVVVELFHFSDVNKNYRAVPEENKTYIGIFHDAIISNKAKSYMKSVVGTIVYEAMSEHMTVVNIEDNYFDNLKYACIGDIHTRIGEFTVGNCLVDIPGTVGRTQYTILQGHNKVDLPLFKINGSTVEKSHLDFPLLSIENSYKVNALEVDKKRRIEGKEFKKALEKITFTKDIRADIENSNIQQGIKEIVIDALEGKTESKAVSLLQQYISKYESSKESK
ncbi:metallophosphoesterase [Clostridium tertium]|uniref:metallophosphoesterase n=1 Tax=Clostridium tertium TaxID=1559 RepID=UPI0023B2B10D|nr:metallophosphoesterase [Clostridium tertium]